MWMRTVTLFAAAAGLSTAVWAATPSDAAVNELLEVARLREQTGNMLKNMEKEIAASTDMLAGARGAKLDADRRQRMQAMQQKMLQILREEMAWEKIQPIYHQVYQETFTAEEVAGMLAFYRTPVGQSVLQKAPQVTERAMHISRERLMPQVLQRMGELLADTDGSGTSSTNSKPAKGAAPAPSGKRP